MFFNFSQNNTFLKWQMAHVQKSTDFAFSSTKSLLRNQAWNCENENISRLFSNMSTVHFSNFSCATADKFKSRNRFFLLLISPCFNDKSFNFLLQGSSARHITIQLISLWTLFVNVNIRWLTVQVWLQTPLFIADQSLLWEMTKLVIRYSPGPGKSPCSGWVLLKTIAAL